MRTISRHTTTKSKSVGRFSAKLLFQFKLVYSKGGSDKRRTCEERIISYRATNAQAALGHAKKVGTSSQYNYKNERGDRIYVEFIGVMDIMQLGPEADPDDVWYDIVDRLLPDERKDKFVLKDEELIRRASMGPRSDVA